MRDTIDMAREAGAMIYNSPHDPKKLIDIMFTPEHLKAFEALVRADEREIVMNEPLTKENWQRFEDEIRADEREKYKWDIHSCGPTCKRYACVAMREAIEAEREACAQLCEDQWQTAHDIQDAIRNRGNT